MAVLSSMRRLLHFANDERDHIASERFLLPERISLRFLVVSAGRRTYRAGGGSFLSPARGNANPHVP